MFTHINETPPMDIAEFEVLTTPKAKRSRLVPFAKQVLELKRKGYAHAQIGQWLASNGVTVTAEAVRQFIKKQAAGDRKESGHSARPSTALTTAFTPARPSQAPGKFVHNPRADASDLLR